MKVSKGKFLIALGVLLVIIDQVIKILVKTNMSIGDSIHVFGDWFQIYFIENEGMAFGMKFGGDVGKFLLSLFRIVLFGFLVWWIGRLLKKGDTPFGVTVGLTMITAGALGNIIDCLFYGLIWDYAPFMFGRVVDMFYFPIIDTVFPDWLPLLGGHPFRFFAPVFNFADSCVTCGALYLLFFQFRFFAKESR
ncbi:MAG: lipoprotein signal peptidase [Bacteroidetes bacterium]|uniref:Lipoprotein signal peptidase n=1 Tax=Candidatus Cryptobacteroides avicola TaxID=2840757 RepID=A0A940DV74_9BACT|nr:lipoprotein signal peptidase [Candidatus Cryptobacteroides avicola]